MNFLRDWEDYIAEERLQTSLLLGIAAWRNSGFLFNCSYCGWPVSQDKNRWVVDIGKKPLEFITLNPSAQVPRVSYPGLCLGFWTPSGVRTICSRQPVLILIHPYSKKVNVRWNELPMTAWPNHYQQCLNSPSVLCFRERKQWLVVRKPSAWGFYLYPREKNNKVACGQLIPHT